MKKFGSFLAVLLLMLASFTAGIEYPRGDVNYDGQVSISDVTCLIDYLMTNSWSEAPVTPPDTHECVDLGLPSGTLWATCNVGADSPEEYGDYFAWGETAPKEYYFWNTYMWCNGSKDTMTKYCTDSSYGDSGFTDDKTELDPDDDAAYVNWGPSWRMPSLEQQQELVDNCTWTWENSNGVNGYLVTGPNSNALFLPASGRRWGGALETGTYGFYWSRTLRTDNSRYAYILNFISGNVYWGKSNYRYDGFAVRAVRVSQNQCNTVL
jgi:hypothetical protein